MPMWAAPPRARCPPTPSRSSRRVCASRRSSSPPRCAAILLANSRTPVERAGDLDAQIGANVVGVAPAGRAHRRGAPVEEVIAYGERRMRAALAAIPDGTWTVRGRARLLGPEPPISSIRSAIVVTLTKAGDRSPSTSPAPHPQSPRQRQRGRGGHRQRGGLRRAGRRRSHHPGQRRLAPAGRVVAPPGTVVAARPPAAVAAGNVEVSQRVADVCLGGAGPGRAWSRRRRRAGDDEQRDRRRPPGGCTTRPWPAGRGPGPVATA